MEERKDLPNETEQTEIKREKVRVIPIRYFDDFPGHPFQIHDDEKMRELEESVREYGVLTPVLARKKPDGRYELISGHRRKYACLKIGIDALPTILRDFSDDEAVIAMVDSNLQRESVYPSEKAIAYRMKLEAMNRQGKRTDLTSTPVVSKLRTSEIVGKEAGESREQIRRYIRLTFLNKDLLALVDQQKIAFRPAVELSYLTPTEQNDLFETIGSEEATPSLSQSIRMKKLSQSGKLDMDSMLKVSDVIKNITVI